MSLHGDFASNAVLGISLRLCQQVLKCPKECLLCKGPQHKFSLYHARVGDFEPLMVNDLIITVEKNIKIDIPGSFVYELLAAHGIFYILELIQESQRTQGGLYLKPQHQKRPPGIQIQSKECEELWELPTIS